MQAAVYKRYGPPEVVELVDLPQPVPQDNEVLIRVRATTVNSGDWRVRSLSVPTGMRTIARLMFGVRRPRQPILGTELAGEVAAVGKAVRAFQPGDRVFAFPGQKMGAHAEYVCVAEAGRVVHTPAGVTDEAATALSFGGTTALSFFRRAAQRHCPRSPRRR